MSRRLRTFPLVLLTLLLLSLPVSISYTQDITDANKSLVEAYVAAENARNFDQLAQYLSDGFVRHSTTTTEAPTMNRAAFLDYVSSTSTQFPDYGVAIEAMVAEGDRVAVYATFQGTQVETRFTLEFPFMAMFRIEDGLIVELWVEWNDLLVMAQLDLLPPLPAAAVPVGLDALTEWDIVWISDSTGWIAMNTYTRYVRDDLAVEVRLHRYALGGLSAGNVLDMLHTPGALSLDIAEAEIVVLYANPEQSISTTNPWDWNCTGRPVVNNCAIETFDQYQADLESIYAEIFRLKDGRPVVVRAYDAYHPLYDNWVETGYPQDDIEACQACWANYNATIHAAAATFDIPVAPVWVAFNGPDNVVDPSTLGYISDDDVHTNVLGADVIATLLREFGYERTAPPQ